jgi:putative ABC transport system substrate-binding protein
MVMGHISEGAPMTAPPPVYSEEWRKHGWIEGQTLKIERRFASRPEQLPAFAAELVALKVDLLSTSGIPATAAAKAATRTIPIMFSVYSDPVEAGLVASLPRPGGNLTGIYYGQYDDKRLQLIKEVQPRAKLVIYLSASPHLEATIEHSAQALGVRVRGIVCTREEDLDRFFDELRAARADAVVVPFLNWSRADTIVRLASEFLAMKMPAVGLGRNFAKAGGLLSFGPKDEYARQAARMDQLLRGANPAEMPVELPRLFDLVINMKTATALGLKISQPLEYRADHVIRE